MINYKRQTHLIDDDDQSSGSGRRVKVRTATSAATGGGDRLSPMAFAAAVSFWFFLPCA